MQVKNYHRKYDEFKTKRQWVLQGYLPKPTANGIDLWANRNCGAIHKYYSPAEVEPATKEQLQEFFRPERERRNEQAKNRRRRQKKQKETEREKEQQEVMAKAITAAVKPYQNIINRLVEKTKALYPKNSYYPKTIVIDTETTGLDPFDDELLQVSIIDTDGNVLFDSYFKPLSHNEWLEAETVNGISPEMVANAPSIYEKAADIYAILSAADMIIGYNTHFDLYFLSNNGLILSDSVKIVDVMELFAPIYGKWSDYHGSYKWQKLITAAEYYGYDWSKRSETAHNSLADCFATLYCYNKINENGVKTYENNNNHRR